MNKKADFSESIGLYESLREDFGTYVEQMPDELARFQHAFGALSAPLQRFIANLVLDFFHTYEADGDTGITLFRQIELLDWCQVLPFSAHKIIFFIAYDFQKFLKKNPSIHTSKIRA